MELVSDAVGWLFHPFIGALAPLLVFMICLFALRPKPLVRASIATLFFSAAAFLFLQHAACTQPVSVAHFLPLPVW